MKGLKFFASIFFLFLPWFLRRHCYIIFFGYLIDRSAKIGFSLVFCDKLEMGPGSKIGSLNVIKGLRLLKLEESSSIGNINWITGFPINDKSFFVHVPDREPALIVGLHSAITNRHLIDCTDKVSLGNFTTFAGFRSQILTHSIDIFDCRQSCKPITIGDYSFIGTGSIILGGVNFPSYSVLAAGSILNASFIETYSLYGGAPAKLIKQLDHKSKYFLRLKGFVN